MVNETDDLGTVRAEGGEFKIRGVGTYGDGHVVGWG
jgi:hypothetical protein